MERIVKRDCNKQQKEELINIKKDMIEIACCILGSGIFALLIMILMWNLF